MGDGPSGSGGIIVEKSSSRGKFKEGNRIPIFSMN